MTYANAIKGLLVSREYAAGTASEPLEDSSSVDIATAIDIHAVMTVGGTTEAHAMIITEGSGGDPVIEVRGQNQNYIPLPYPIRVAAPYIVTTATEPTRTRIFYTPAV